MSRREDEAARPCFEQTARAALDFLARVTFPDGGIPLFNDSAFGIAPRTDALVAYGERLFGYLAPAGEEREILRFPASGYFGARSGDGTCGSRTAGRSPPPTSRVTPTATC